MQLHVYVDPRRGSTYRELAATARAAEELGFDGFFRSDRYVAPAGLTGLPGAGDAWTTLAGLAGETRRIRLGTLMTAATFRLPGPLAVSVATVDQMSEGRVDFGFGAGGHERDHSAYGVPFPAPRERFDRFEEQLAVVTGLWGTPLGRTFSHRGRHYRLTDSPALPKPVQRPGPPVIIGGRGTRRTPRLAARYAAEYNHRFPALEELKPQRDRLCAACEEAGRDPSSLRISALLPLACGDCDAEVARRARAGRAEAARLWQDGLVGSPARVVDRIGEFADAGVDRIYVQTPRQFDVEHYAFFADRVMRQLV